MYFYPLLIIIFLACMSAASGNEQPILIGFTMGKHLKPVPEGWELLAYLGKAKNDMSLIKEGKRAVLHVKSLNSASALLKRIDVDPESFPILVWRWKVNRTVGMAIESRKDRNDSSARVRVIFGNGQTKSVEENPGVKKIIKYLGVKVPRMEPAGFKIDYIWGNHTPKGKIIDYPGSRNHKVVIVERGNTRANQWIWEKQNLIEDFRQMFKVNPPKLTGIVVLSDTDQTNEGVEACYSSIVLMQPE
jgi:hypothetical protein